MELLKTLYSIYSPSGNEKKMRRFIKRWIMKNVANAQITTDAKGNIYVIKGSAENYPCIVSHIDQVQKTHSKDFVCIESKEVIFGYSPKNHRQEGLGADDKNGIWIALKCLEKYDTMKAAFSWKKRLAVEVQRKQTRSSLLIADTSFSVIDVEIVTLSHQYLLRNYAVESLSKQPDANCSVMLLQME